MRGILFVLFLIIIKTTAFGQKQSLVLGLDFGLFAWNDNLGVIKKIEYTYDFNEKYTFGVEYNNIVIVNNRVSNLWRNQTISVREFDYPFEWCKDCDDFDHGFYDLPSYLRKQIQSTLDLTGYKKLFKNLNLTLGIGLSLTRVDLTSVSLNADGYFDSIIADNQQINLIVFKLENYLDAGYNVKLKYDISLNERISYGFRVAVHRFIFSQGYNYYSSIGANFSVKF